MKFHQVLRNRREAEETLLQVITHIDNLCWLLYVLVCLAGDYLRRERFELLCVVASSPMIRDDDGDEGKLLATEESRP